MARACRAAARPLVLVPTMGALHAGHLALVARARKLAGPHGTVALSLFVNPTQFGPKEDFSRYPRPLREDTAQCRAAGVDLLFTPSAAAMYEPDQSVWIDEEALSATLCGASRPGHFRGVCTVVGKLFNLTGADAAVFGKKDVQQLAIIRRMVRDLNFPVRIVGVETVRERDGLAMSSRNRYLTPQERSQAPILQQALRAARKRAREGGVTPEALAARVSAQIGSAPLARIDYVSILDAETLRPPVRGKTERWLIALAVFFGKTRLIDHLEIPAP